MLLNLIYKFLQGVQSAVFKNLYPAMQCPVMMNCKPEQAGSLLADISQHKLKPGRIQKRALLNLGMNFFMKGARRAPFIKKFIHEISNTQKRFTHKLYRLSVKRY